MKKVNTRHNTHSPAASSFCIEPRLKPRSAVRLVTAAIAMSLIAACSSDGNDDEPAANTPPVAVTNSTDELKNNAVNAAGRNLGNTLAGVQQLASDEDTSNTLAQGDNPAQQFVASTLALDDVGNAVTTREGNRVLIDPDEIQLCAEEFAETLDVNEDQQRCETLLSDLSVELLASDQDAGVITYLFQDNPVLSLGYGNSVDSLAVNLGGLKTFADANDALDPNSFGETTLPDTMSGEISFIATNTNNTSGQEAGSIALAITQPIEISSPDTSLSLGNGELFSINADSGSGNGGLSFDIGAISAMTPFRDDDIASFNLDGFTGSASLDLGETAADAPATITVSNLGLGRGPLQMNINNQQALQMTMETFGFTVTPDANVLSDDGQASVQIDNTMDIALMINNATGIDMNSSPSLQAMLSLQAAGGTVLTNGGAEFNAPDIRVIQGGPFMLSLSTSDDESSQDQSFSVNAGECLFFQSEDVEACP